MSEPADREDRFLALDRFAESKTQDGGASLPMQAFSSTGDRIIGAQKVAVKRNSAIVRAEIDALAAAAGEAWYYRFPVQNRKEGRTDYIEGPSIKLANDLARIYGNCDVDVRVQDIGDAWIFHARFTDFETGFSMSRPFQQRKLGGARIGGSDDQRRLDISMQIGASKAIRNVVCNALQTWADYAFEEAKNTLVDKIGKELPKWRDRTVHRLVELNVDLKRVERTIGRIAADWRAPDVAQVIAMMKSVQDGMASLDETFPPLEPAPTANGSGALDNFAEDAKAKRKGKDTTQATEIESTGARKGKDAPPATEIESTGERTEIESDTYKLAQQLVIACEKAVTPDEIYAAYANFEPRIKALPSADDRLDIKSISDRYLDWRLSKISEKECESSVFDRLELIKGRQNKKGGR